MIAVLTTCGLLIVGILFLTGLAVQGRIQRYLSERHVLKLLADDSTSPPSMPDSRRAKPLNSPGAWFETDDYPPAAVRAGEEGRVRVKVAISSEGMPIGCRVLTSSGYSPLDRVTCDVVMKKGRFRAAIGRAGEPIPAIWESPGIVWRLSE